MVIKFFHKSYQRVKAGLQRTGAALGSKLRSLLGQRLDEEALEDLERLFYEADLGVALTETLIAKVKELSKENLSSDERIAALRAVLLEEISSLSPHLVEHQGSEPFVILIVGVNGNGKTTSVAKLARHFKKGGKTPLLCAADTFRAAAIDQLEQWSSTIGCDIVKGMPKSDPSAVVYDALDAARARDADCVLIDTAGRLHTKTELMHELEKLRRVCHKVIPGAPHETLLVLDATTGQNALDQARIFNQFTPISGLILTKLDGTAKGGICLAIQKELGIPVKFIGVGEDAEDLQPFVPEEFLDALFATT